MAEVEKLTYNADELAQALGLSASTVKQYATREPDKLPPPMKTGLRRRMWSVQAVKDWVASRVTEQAVQE